MTSSEVAAMKEKCKFITVIKFGGAITENGTEEQIKDLVDILDKIHLKKPNFVIIPGGGAFAEEIRRMQKRHHFSDEIAHQMAVLAIDQHALLLYHYFSRACLVDYSPNRFMKNLEKILPSQIPILTIANFMRKESQLEHTWNSTSDAITVEIAENLHATEIIFIKDIDGIKVNEKVISKITIDELRALKASPLDKNTPEMLRKNRITTYIINGFYPQRIEELLINKKYTILTEITYKSPK